VIAGSSNGVAESDVLRAAEADYREQVRRDLPRNFTAHLFHGLFGQTGFRLLNAPTFLPAYLFLLTGGELVIGIARSAQSLGMFLSPILGATAIEHRKRVLPLGFLVGGSMRLTVLGIALAGFFLSDEWAVRAICVLLVCFGFFMGMQGVIFSYLMSKVIPVERRGTLLGIRNALGGLMASGVAYLGGKYLVGPDVFGNGFSTTFLLAFVLTSFGLMMLLGIREPEPPQVRKHSRVADRLRELPALLRADRGFTLYFLARALATMGRMAVPFYFVYAGREIGITGESLAILTPCFLLANSTMNLPWGQLADRRGFRVVFLASIWLWIGSVVVLMSSSTILARVRRPGGPSVAHRCCELVVGVRRSHRPACRRGDLVDLQPRNALLDRHRLPVGRHPGGDLVRRRAPASERPTGRREDRLRRIVTVQACDGRLREPQARNDVPVHSCPPSSRRRCGSPGGRRPPTDAGFRGAGSGGSAPRRGRLCAGS